MSALVPRRATASPRQVRICQEAEVFIFWFGGPQPGYRRPKWLFWSIYISISRSGREIKNENVQLKREVSPICRECVRIRLVQRELARTPSDLWSVSSPEQLTSWLGLPSDAILLENFPYIDRIHYSFFLYAADRVEHLLLESTHIRISRLHTEDMQQLRFSIPMWMSAYLKMHVSFLAARLLWWRQLQAAVGPLLLHFGISSQVISYLIIFTVSLGIGELLSCTQVN